VMRNPFRYFNSSPEVIRLVVMMYIRYPLSLRQVEDILFERGIDICHDTVRFWWNRFGPMFASEIRKRRIHHRSFSRWRWHLDESAPLNSTSDAGLRDPTAASTEPPWNSPLAAPRNFRELSPGGCPKGPRTGRFFLQHCQF